MEKEPCISPRELVIIRERCRVAKAPVSPGGTLLCKLQHRGILPVGLSRNWAFVWGSWRRFCSAKNLASQGPETREKRRIQVQEFSGQQREQMCFMVIHWINDGFSLLQKHFNVAGYLGYFQILFFVDIAATNILIYIFWLYLWLSLDYISRNVFLVQKIWISC